jgi:Transposase DDE domain
VRLADLGYFSLRVLAEQPQVYFLVRPQTNVIVYDAAGDAFHLDEFLRQCQCDEMDQAVFVGSSQHLPCRLLARRVPPEVAQQRRRRLKERARKKGATLSPTTLALADWTLFLTNVPSQLLSLSEAFAVARCRWQIELVFKLWKSLGRLDDWCTTNPWRILCEVYAKLLIMLLQHWLFLLCQLSRLDRSFIQAAQTLQQFALTLASTLSSPSRFRHTLLSIKRCLSHGCRLNRSRKHPRTFQLLEGLA